MRRTILILSLVLFVTSCMSLKTTTVSMDATVRDIDISLDKKDGWVKANNWMVETFVSAEDVIQFSDKENGVITGKYKLITPNYTVMNTTYPLSVFSIIKVQVKDGKARITVDPADFQTIDNPKGRDRSVTPNKVMVEKEIESLIKGFQDYMINDKSLESF